MERKELINRLNRVQGQIESIKRSLESGEPIECMKTMQLLKAANNALKKFGEVYVAQHMEECMNNNRPRKDMEKELKDVINAAFTF